MVLCDFVIVTMVYFSVEDGVINEEFLLKRITLQDLCSESAKLKSLGAMEMIPTDKLVRLLSVLEINIRGGDRMSPIADVSSCFMLIRFLCIGNLFLFDIMILFNKNSHFTCIEK